MPEVLLGTAALVVAALVAWVVVRCALRPFLRRRPRGARMPRGEAD